jgi:Lipase (class 3)
MIYSFAFSISPAYGHQFSSVTDMQNYVTLITGEILSDSTPQGSIIQGLIGDDWAQVWGPIVYAKVTTGATVVADNTMGCFYSPSQKMFVIAIAGTNAISEFDWMDEDLAVHTLVPWNTVSPGAPATSGNISNATSIGLQKLLAMQDLGGKTLLQELSSYIASHDVTGATVALCGHSLAGALSPCLALYLVENRSAWDSAAPHSVSAYPTAGPTPGDNGFAAYYESVIAAGHIGYSSLYNTLDVVPLAWASAGLAQMPSIYDANIQPATSDNPPDAFMGVVASGLWLDGAAATQTIFGHKAPANTYTHISTGRTPLTGTFDTTADNSVSQLANLWLILPSGLTAYSLSLYNVARFVAQAVAQHTQTYPGLVNISDFETEYKQILTNNPPSNAVPINLTRNAVKKVTGVDLHKIDTEALASAAAAAAAKKTE